MNDHTTNQIENLFRPHAARLAKFIDSKAGGHPLMNGLPSFVADGLLWQYGNYDFIIYTSCQSRKFPSTSELQNASPNSNVIHVQGIEEALKLIEMTEACRQE